MQVNSAGQPPRQQQVGANLRPGVLILLVGDAPPPPHPPAGQQNHEDAHGDVCHSNNEYENVQLRTAHGRGKGGLCLRTGEPAGGSSSESTNSHRLPLICRPITHHLPPPACLHAALPGRYQRPTAH